MKKAHTVTSKKTKKVVNTLYVRSSYYGYRQVELDDLQFTFCKEACRNLGFNRLGKYRVTVEKLERKLPGSSS